MKVKDKPQKPGFASLMKQFTNVDPYQCVLCGGRMVFNSEEAGIRAERLLDMRRSNLQQNAGYDKQHRDDPLKIQTIAVR